MMTSGDEPQLGGQDHDDSVQHESSSTRSARQFASAYGAYQAGDIDTLIIKMNLLQQNQFRQALVAHAVWFGEQHIGDVTKLQQGMARLLEAGREWLRNPSTDVASILAPLVSDQILDRASDNNYYFHVRRGVKLSDEEEDELNPFWMLLQYLTSTSLYRIQPTFGFYGGEAERQWKLEAAWAVLNNRPLPPLEDHD